MKARHLIWSSDEKKRGRICARMIHTDVKSLRENEFADPVKENMARVRLFAWLRRADQVFPQNNNSNDDSYDIRDLLPTGFFDSSMHLGEAGLPSCLLQTG